MAWYVLFVKTGYEQKIASEISRAWSIGDSKPFVPTYKAHFKKAGKIYLEKRRVYPGYVFIDSKLNGLDFYILAYPFIRRSENTFRLLRYGSENVYGNNFEMKSEEYLAFLQLYDKEYCIEMSKGVIEENFVHITDGPLKGLENRIKKVRASKMEAVVELTMFGSNIDTKVGLEIIKNCN